MNLSEDEIQTIKLLIQDWGWEYGLTADRKKVGLLGKKLGMEDIFINDWIKE